MSVVDETVTIESNTKMEISNNDISLKSVSLSLTEINPITETKNVETNKTEKVDKVDKNGKPLKNDKNEKHGFKKNASTVIAPVAITNLSKYFLDRVDPSPRINPCLMVRNNLSVLVLFIMFILFILCISFLYIFCFTTVHIFTIFHSLIFYVCVCIRVRTNVCALKVKGNTLYIYGGMTELGDIEVTLDDCW